MRNLIGRIRGKALAMACAGAVLGGLAMAQPAQAAAAPTCATLWKTVNNSAGHLGGSVKGHFCVSPDTGYAYRHNGHESYVHDFEADGVAARAYVRHGGVTKLIGTDNTSSPWSTTLDSWDSSPADNGPDLKLFVCLGTARPGAAGARCDYDYMHA
ncbi:hypothetical protein ACWEFL_27045 [Streptomyces sp. NPDC004838]